MRNNTPFVLGALVAVLCVTSDLSAQATAAPSAPAASPTTPSPPAPGSTGVDRGLGTGASAKPGSLASMAKYDGTFLRDAAQASTAEVALGNLAQKQAASASVKAFAQKMVTDHTRIGALAYPRYRKEVKDHGDPVGRHLHRYEICAAIRRSAQSWMLTIP